MNTRWVEHLGGLLRPHPGWLTLISTLLLTLIGFAAIHTIAPDEAASQWQRALPVALVGLTICLIPHPKTVGLTSYLLLALAIALLVFVLLPGVPRSIVPIRNGARSWIDLGVMTFQPSELSKIAFVLAMAWYLRFRESYRTLRGLLVPFVIMLVPVALILKEPDLGTALLFAPTLAVMLVAAGAKLRHLSMLVGLAVFAVALNVAVIAIDPPHLRQNAQGSPVAWLHVLKPHQEKRIAAMIWPERYQKEEAFQSIVARRLIGAGGVTGLGAERAGTLVRFNALPEAHNDMIFAVIVCRWGLVGGWTVIGLYLVLTGSFVLAAARVKEPFSRLACVGFAGMIFTQAALNIGVSLGLFPTTGVTLPLISDGGSSLLATYMMIGLVLNFASRRPAPLARPSFEFDHADAIFQ